jgi:hypothetical protein
MKEVVEGMQRRRSVQIEAIPVSSKPEESEEDAGLKDEIPEDSEAIAEEPLPLPVDARPITRAFPATPKMSDLKHVFSERHAANANVPTSYAGVRELFKAEHAPIPETPRLDGVREMFFRAREQEPNTSLFEGVGEMLESPPGYVTAQGQGSTQNDEVEMESTTEIIVPALKRSRGRRAVSGHASKPGSRTAAKMPAVRPAREGRTTPTETPQLADDELTPDVPPAKPSKHNANAPKGSIVRRRTTRRAENETKEVIILTSLQTEFGADAAVPAKLASRARKGVVTPEITGLPVASQPEKVPARRSRTTTKSTESTESEIADSGKPARKTKRGAKAVATAPEPEPEPELTKSLRGGTKRSQSIEVVIPAPTTTKRRMAKSKASEAAADAPANDRPPPDAAADRPGSPGARPAARGRRGKTKSVETEEDESAGVVGALRTVRGRRTPPATATVTAAAAAASKVRAAAATSSAKSVQAAAVGEKENTPEQIHVKEEEEERLPVPPVAKGARVRRTAAGAPNLKAQSEPEKDAPVAKARAPRTRAATARK